MNMILKKLAPPPFIPVKAMVGAPVRLIITCVFLLWYGTTGGINWLWVTVLDPMYDVTGCYDVPYYQTAFRNIRGSWRWTLFGVSSYEYQLLQRGWEHDRAVEEARRKDELDNAKEISGS